MSRNLHFRLPSPSQYTPSRLPLILRIALSRIAPTSCIFAPGGVFAPARRSWRHAGKIQNSEILSFQRPTAPIRSERCPPIGSLSARRPSPPTRLPAARSGGAEAIHVEAVHDRSAVRTGPLCRPPGIRRRAPKWRAPVASGARASPASSNFARAGGPTRLRLASAECPALRTMAWAFRFAIR